MAVRHKSHVGRDSCADLLDGSVAAIRDDGLGLAECDLLQSVLAARPVGHGQALRKAGIHLGDGLGQQRREQRLRGSDFAQAGRFDEQRRDQALGGQARHVAAPDVHRQPRTERACFTAASATRHESVQHRGLGQLVFEQAQQVLLAQEGEKRGQTFADGGL